MTSEWLKIMLEEIARKKAENERARLEEERRREVVPDHRPVESEQCAPGRRIGDAE
jgi:hypothetical protein